VKLLGDRLIEQGREQRHVRTDVCRQQRETQRERVVTRYDRHGTDASPQLIDQLAVGRIGELLGGQAELREGLDQRARHRARITDDQHVGALLVDGHRGCPETIVVASPLACWRLRKASKSPRPMEMPGS